MPPKVYGPPRTDFGPPPPGYIPGVGRGAVGFTTRADVGPMMALASGAPFVPERGQGPAAIMRQREALKELQQKIAEDGAASNEGSLFSTGAYEADDAAADRAYDEADAYAGVKRSRLASATTSASANTGGGGTVRLSEHITAQFADVRRELATVTAEQWGALPESLDYSRQNKLTNASVNRVTLTAAPDSLIMAGASAAGADGAGIDVDALGRAREHALAASLDRASASSHTVTSTSSTSALLEDIDGTTASGDAASRMSMGDVKRLRALYKSAVTTNPTHAPSWVAAARLERSQGRLADARRIIDLACEHCPLSEDVWLEAVDLNPGCERAVLATAVRSLPRSQSLWLRAAKSEQAPAAQRAVLRRALEVLPKAVPLWRAAVALEEPDDARILLSRAVELVPAALELWLALARLESYDGARAVLNAARRALPGERAVWMAAARLEETRGNDSNVAAVVAAAVRSLTAQNAIGTRKDWLNEAVAAEREGCLLVCQAIVAATATLNITLASKQEASSSDSGATAATPLSDDELIAVWRADVDALLNKNSGNHTTASSSVVNASSAGYVSESGFVAIDTARSLLQHAVATFPAREALWITLTEFEAAHGDLTLMRAVLAKAVERCPRTELLWLRAARLARDSGSLETARGILDQAFQANPKSEEIWLAAGKIEADNGDIARARALLDRARERTGTARVWVRAAKYARFAGDAAALVSLLTEGVKRFPAEWKLWLMLAQHHAAPLYPTISVLTAQQRNTTRSSTINGGVSSNSAPLSSTLSSSSSSSSANANANAPTNASAAAGQNSFALLTEAAIAAARTAFRSGSQHCPNAAALWVEYVRFERALSTYTNLSTPGSGTASASSDARARAVLERARAALPNSDALWIEAIYLETNTHSPHSTAANLAAAFPNATAVSSVSSASNISANSAQAALQTLARAQKACPDSGALWALAVELETRPQRKARAMAALERCGDDGRVLLAVAKWFWERSKAEEARSWFERAVAAAPALGDAWAFYLKFERERVDAALAAARAEANTVAAAAAAASEVKLEHSALTTAASAPAAAGVKSEHSGAITVKSELDTSATAMTDSTGTAPAVVDIESNAGVCAARARVASVETRCAAARPRYGERWAPVWKRDSVVTPAHVAVLREVADGIREIFGKPLFSG